ncbi:class I SAM-dependent methyltransferase [Streptosporangium sp. NPDC051022]|uniref:class I SAM-dependent methyltransferase n=1 Tax=Streptosporangium sp. NPDC051022 TaxID=3155752 RepID=UPI003420A139
MSRMETVSRDRFAFGDNWLKFIELMDDRRIDQAVSSLREALGVADLAGRTFLDIGCGSGLFSLAALRLGARVHSFDYDPDSVAACGRLRERYAGDRQGEWTVEQGSILDDAYVQALGTFDVVYSWGVLHHTGEMWRAIANASVLAAPGGTLFISIYNDQGAASRLWWKVKRRYVQGGPLTRRALVMAGEAYFGARNTGGRLVKAACGIGGPRGDRLPPRGMSLRHDLVDWIGGFPFEVATPERIFSFLRERGFALSFLKTCGGGIGCNEYVFTAPPRA